MKSEEDGVGREIPSSISCTYRETSLRFVLVVRQIPRPFLLLAFPTSIFIL